MPRGARCKLKLCHEPTGPPHREQIRDKKSHAFSKCSREQRLNQGDRPDADNLVAQDGESPKADGTSFPEPSRTAQNRNSRWAAVKLYQKNNYRARQRSYQFLTT
jgi:hypothetical protein